MLYVLVCLIAFLVLISLLFWIVKTLALPEPVSKVLTVVVVALIVVVVVVWIVQWASAGAPMPHFPVR